MNIAQLRMLIAVVEEGSFSSAARKLGVSQPGATMQVQSLEASLGQSLLIRHHRGIELSDAGKIFLPFAYETVKNYALACAEIDGLKADASGPLQLAISTTPGDYIIPALLSEFLKLYPNITPSMSVTSSRIAVSRVEDRIADIAYVGKKEDCVALDFIPSGTDELVLIANPKHPLAGKDTVSLAELAAQDWVRRPSDSGTQKVIVEFFDRQGIDANEFNYLVELGTGEAIVNAVENNMGIAILSRHVAARALESGSVVELAAEGLPIKRPFYLVLPRQGMSRNAEVFKDFLLAAMKADDE